MSQHLEVHTHGGIRELRLARPPANALSPPMVDALRTAIAEAPDQGAEALLLSGRPGMFSAGLDVPALLPLERDEILALWTSFFGLMRALAESPIPLGAAITGHSPAGGAVIALYCDRRVMAEGPFQIGLNEVQVGISLPEALIAPLRAVVGSRQAERLGTEGRMVSAEEALAIGLVDELAPVDEVIPRAIASLERMLAAPRQAMLETRANFRAAWRRGFEGADEQLAGVVDQWFRDETQAALTQLVESLRRSKE